MNNDLVYGDSVFCQLVETLLNGIKANNPFFTYIVSPKQSIKYAFMLETKG